MKIVSKTSLRKVKLRKQIHEYEGDFPSTLSCSDDSVHLPLLSLPSLDIDQMPTMTTLRVIGRQSLSSWNDNPDVSDFHTQFMPVMPLDHIAQFDTTPMQTIKIVAMSEASVLTKLVKSSGIYALSSVVPPLVTLGLAPFLTRHLSPSDYGTFILLNSFTSLTAGISQLGLGSAFFRAYSYDYSSDKDRRDVLATVTSLLILASFITVVGAVLFAPFLAGVLLGQSSRSSLIVIAAGIIFAQNLSVPIFSWLRAENRPLVYSLLSISNLLVVLILNLILVGVISLGITGSLIANGSGYACVTICALPFILRYAGMKVRIDISRNVLAFGLPLVFNVISYWALQVLDRYLLSLFSSLVQTAEYAVAYSLGSALSVVIIAPFGLAWPTMQFSIAKRKDAALVFQQTFRLFGLLLLFAAYGLSLTASILLNWLFPPVYRTAISVIPIIAASLVFFGIYNIFVTGISISRKTWLIGIYSAIAAATNLLLNLVLIPRYQAMGAAIATLLAYIVLAVVGYVVNQRIYPIPFEIGKFVSALLLGVFFFVGGNLLAQSLPPYLTWYIYFALFGIYSGCLYAFARLPIRRRKFLQRRKEEGS